jgi:hypothetical protein
MHDRPPANQLALNINSLVARVRESKEMVKTRSPLVQLIYDYRYYQVRFLLTRIMTQRGAKVDASERYSNIMPAYETFKLIPLIRSDARLRTWHSFQEYDYIYAMKGVVHALCRYPPEDKEYLDGIHAVGTSLREGF